MTYQCLIVDDEKLGRDLIKSYIEQFPYLEVCGECSSAIEAMPILSKQKIDLLFLDINMPQISGMDLLRQHQPMPLTVLCTAYSEYALESYDLDVVDYLLKPIELLRFSKAIAKAMARLQPQITIPAQVPPIEEKPSYFFVKADYKKVKIEVEHILYIEAMEKYIRIHTTTDKILTLMSMSKIMEQLPTDEFLRIHRSYIVNKNKIDMLEGNMVIINNQKLPVSKANRKLLNELI